MSLPTALGWLAERGRWLLIAGLLAGLALPGLARAMAPALVPLIGAMLCLAALREGPGAALPARHGLARSVGIVAVLQVALPLVGGGLLWAAGWLAHPVAIAVVLALAAAPITGSPGLAVMSGGSARAALRQLTLGTALLPLTATPVFAMLPLFPDAAAIWVASGRLLALVALAAGLAWLLRAAVPALRRPAARPAIDGLMALTMALVVIALMSEVGPAVLSAPLVLAAILALAFGVHGAQMALGWQLSRLRLPRPDAVSVAIVAGNRNLALFLVAAPPEVMAPMMVFVGAYQVPMYLTPFLIGWLARGGGT